VILYSKSDKSICFHDDAVYYSITIYSVCQAIFIKICGPPTKAGGLSCDKPNDPGTGRSFLSAFSEYDGGV
jgi:hypothetical protein